MPLLKNLFLALVVCLALPAAAQKTGVPATFSISAKDLSVLLSASPDTRLSFPANPYLDKALAVKNVRNGDMQFVRLKLAYFKNAYLNVQVNGIYTTQVFLMSEGGSTFYKGQSKGEDKNVLMEKCTKDDIVVE